MMGTKTFDPLAVLGLYTETPLHCGSESSSGYVDLPVQRERHTDFPVIPGSTIKGVLRDEFSKLGRDGQTLDQEFGKAEAKDNNASGAAGSVSFGDGMLVAFPVRSSNHPFHWVTCPFALERVFRAMGNGFPEGLCVVAGNALAKANGTVLLEEIALTKEARNGLFSENGELQLLLSLIPSTPGFNYTRSIFLDRLLIVSDADFTELVKTGTEVLTRIKLTALGTTTDLKKGEHPEIKGDDRKGNMFVEEVVPPETLFFCALRAAKTNPPLLDNIPSVLRIGGDETIGRGLTHVTKFDLTA
jgi:CRISPR-associated protein Cmr4